MSVIATALIALSPAAASAKKVRYELGQRALAEGARGPDVRELQRSLTVVGVRTPVDGQFGPITTRRVRSWERLSERPIDGLVSRSDAGALQAQVDAGATLPGGSAPSTEPVAVGAPVESATLNADGTATAPPSAPQEVKDVIDAANQIVGKRYRRGGGHARWAIDDTGVDCSGAVSWALHGGGLLKKPLASPELMKWKRRGRGDWLTVHSNEGHVFLVVANLRFDTGYHNGDGPRWSEKMRPDEEDFTARHPAGL